MVRFDGSDFTTNSNSNGDIDGSTLNSLYISSRLGILTNGILSLPTIPNVEANLTTLNSSIDNYDYILSQTEANESAIEQLQTDITSILTQPTTFTGDKTFKDDLIIGALKVAYASDSICLNSMKYGQNIFVQGSDGSLMINSSNNKIIDFQINYADKAQITTTGFTSLGTLTSNTLNPKLLLLATTGGSTTPCTIDFQTYSQSVSTIPTARIVATDTGDYTNSLNFLTKLSGNASNALVSRLYIDHYGNVGINTSAPKYSLDVYGTINCQNILVDEQEFDLATINNNITYLNEQVSSNTTAIGVLQTNVEQIWNESISFSGIKKFQDDIYIGSTLISNDTTALRICNYNCPFFSLYQSNEGETILNSSNSQQLTFKIDNVEQAKITSDGTLTVDGSINCSALLIANQNVDITSINSQISTINTALTQVVNGEFENDITAYLENPKLSLLGYGGANSTASIDLSTYVNQSTTVPTTRIIGTDTGDYTNSLNILTKKSGSATNSLVSRLFISNNGNVGVNNSSPQYQMDIGGTLNCSFIYLNGEPISEFVAGVTETFFWQDCIHYNWTFDGDSTTEFKLMNNDTWFCFGWNNNAKYYNDNLTLTPFITSLIQDSNQYYPIACDTTLNAYGKFYISNDNSYFDNILINALLYTTTGYVNLTSFTFKVRVYYVYNMIDLYANYYESPALKLSNVILETDGNNNYMINTVFDLSLSLNELALPKNTPIDVRLVFTDWDSTEHSGVWWICIKDFQWKLNVKTT